MANQVVCKYSALVDEFVQIRVFGDQEIRELLNMRENPSRRGYQQLVISACVVDYNDTLLRKVIACEQFENHEPIEGHFYELAISVNPKLDLNCVTIPVEDEAAANDLHLFPANPTGSGCASPSPLESLLKKVARTLESEIKKRVIGQEQAISSVSKAIQKATIGFRDPRRPIGAFFFVGQTGVGKTELAKALNDCLFSDAERLVRVDCSEYSLPHEYAKLIGAPPGYIGYDEGGYLTDRAKAGPCILLFDEVEKAHSKVHNLLLQILDEGWVTDSKGDRINFQEAMIILTSNLGVDRIDKYRNLMGFDSGVREPPSREFAREATLAALKEEFRPEFINRIDEVVVFNSLSMKDCHQIVRNLLGEIADRAKNQEISLVFTRRSRDLLVRKGFSAEYGARELKRTLRDLIENPLTEGVINESIHPGSRVCVDVRGDELVFRCRPDRRRRGAD